MYSRKEASDAHPDVPMSARVRTASRDPLEFAYKTLTWIGNAMRFGACLPAFIAFDASVECRMRRLRFAIRPAGITDRADYCPPVTVKLQDRHIDAVQRWS